MNFIINLLFKSFIENGATLDKFVVYFPDSLKLRPEIFYLLEQNMQFISRLQYLFLSRVAFSNIESATTLLRTLAKYATKIKDLKLREFDTACDSYKTQLFHAIIQIIKSQERLRLISINGIKNHLEFHSIISALESQKNSLQEAIIEKCGWSAEFEILKSCKNLDTFRIRFCDMKLLKILNCKISTLEILNRHWDISTTTQILEMSGLMLNRLRLISVIKGYEETSILVLEALKSFCPNITYLDLGYMEFSTPLIEVIGNLQKLQFLSLLLFQDNIDETKEEQEVRVIHFAEILPLTLQYLRFCCNSQLNSCIDIFLNHCNSPLKTLSIYRLSDEKTVKALIEFSKRNRTLNCVGLYNYDLNYDIRKKIEKYVRLESYGYTDVDC
ncbi:hypothetical protein C2G38_2084602 [Gigaspora rosea]|uniref:F-box domain-containing protein n=1 Tax=Gigaspora rosea TaxID=44941 RepID=A0A397V8J3_9GLOM|nr:hypothetical protein C2G38_2084602 [Gigaspora rosea]